MLTPIKTKMTAADYFQLPETIHRTQLIDGVFTEMTSPEIEHQQIIVRFVLLFAPIIQALGGETFIAPMDVQFDDDNVPQPDVFWIAPNGRCKPNDKNRLSGAPDLIAEVLSPSTKRNDRVDKFMLYERHGVSEYWIVDPLHREVEVWNLENGEYVLQGTYTAQATFQSTRLNGWTIAVKDIFAGV